MEDIHLHKVRIIDYDKVNDDFLAYKCDWNYANYKLLGNENIQPKTIFIKIEFIESFYNTYYKKIHKDTKFIIISGGSDITIPNNVDERFKDLHLIKNNKKIVSNMLNDDRLICWYCENCDELLPKMKCIPTGIITNNVLELYYKHIYYYGKHIEFDNNVNVLCCHRVRNFTKDRIKVNEICKNEWKSLITNIERIDNSSFIDELSKYTFTLCVQGGGLDPSPKAFECIIAGSIPIIKYSIGIYDAYKELPVVFINDWNEKEITHDKLKIWLNKLRKYYEEPMLRKEVLYKLSGNYWWNKISNTSIELCINNNN